MNESDVKRQMSKSMLSAGGYSRRFEDQYGVGIYDMILIPKGLPAFFAEVKIIRNSTFGPTPRQAIELGRIEALNSPHAIPVMIGWRDGIFYFHPPKLVIGIDECHWTDLKIPFHDQLVVYYKRIANEPYKAS